MRCVSCASALRRRPAGKRSSNLLLTRLFSRVMPVRNQPASVASSGGPRRKPLPISSGSRTIMFSTMKLLSPTMIVSPTAAPKRRASSWLAKIPRGEGSCGSACSSCNAPYNGYAPSAIFALASAVGLVPSAHTSFGFVLRVITSISVVRASSTPAARASKITGSVSESTRVEEEMETSPPINTLLSARRKRSVLCTMPSTAASANAPTASERPVISRRAALRRSMRTASRTIIGRAPRSAHRCPGA